MSEELRKKWINAPPVDSPLRLPAPWTTSSNFDTLCYSPTLCYTQSYSHHRLVPADGDVHNLPHSCHHTHCGYAPGSGRFDFQR